MKKLLLGLGSITAVVAPVAAVVSCGDDEKTNAQAQLDQIVGDAGKISVPATIDHTTVHASVILKELPTNLSAETVDLIVADIVKANLTNVNLATTIEVLATKMNLKRTATAVEMKTYTITVAKGDATNAAAVKTAAALPASAGQAPADNSGTTDGGNTGSGSTGTGTGSGSTDGGNTAATTTDLTAAAYVGTAWHSAFRTGGSTPALPEAHHVFTVTVNTLKLTYTWTAADNTALAGFIATTQTKTQDDVVIYLATKLAGTDTKVTADQVKTAFGITSATGQHTFTTGTSGATATTGQAKVTLTLDGSGAALDANGVADAIIAATGYGTATTSADLTGLSGVKLTVGFAAGADKTVIAAAFTTAIGTQTTFTNCFATPTTA